MRHRALFVTVALSASVVGALSGVSLGRASTASACERDRINPSLAAADIQRGIALPAVVFGRSIVAVRDGGDRPAFGATTGGDEIVRHVTARAGVGTAYVVDRRGPDVIVIRSVDGVIRLEQPGEATHPSWSDDGRLVWSVGSQMRMWSPARGILAIDPPDSAIGLFSPVFMGTDSVVAVVAEPEPGFTRTEDEGLNNLWRYDLTARRWSRLTAFRARGDRWVGVRTPLVRSDGSTEFVRISGLSSTTRMPSFELWEATPSGAVSRMRSLPREMYLAGVLGGRRVWNVFDQAAGEWRLLSERSETTFQDLGCGAVTVDPRSVGDPDRMPPAPPAPTPAPTPTEAPIPSPTTPYPTAAPVPEPGYETGILVGDFSSIDQANEAVFAIKAALGDETVVEVVDSLTAPNIVLPGVWAAVLLLPTGVDALAALDDFRTRLPEFQGWSWVVSV
jgi:hypothetical protein